MRTSKPISTISYNTPEFLRAKIEYWKSTGTIEYGMWIRHEPEADEKKAHYHVYLKPAQLIQTMNLENESMEFDPLNPEKPLKMIGFRISKEDDWVLYGLHDASYLLEKGLEREHHYDIADIQSTDEDTLADILTHINDNRKGDITKRIIDLIQLGLTWQQICASGLIPLRYMTNAKTLYNGIVGTNHI